METKPFYQSKFVIMGILEIVIGVLVFIQGEVGAGAAITGKGILDIVLRLMTKQAVQAFGE